jgi:hypothetical protein
VIPGVSVLDAAYALSVAGAAMLWPPLALVVAAGYFVASAWIADHRAPEAAK